MLCFGRDVFFGFTIYLQRAREHMSYRTLQTFMLFVTSMYRAVLATVKSSPFRWALLVVVLILMQPEHAARLFQLQALWKATQLITEKFFAIYVISFLVMVSCISRHIQYGKAGRPVATRCMVDTRPCVKRCGRSHMYAFLNQIFSFVHVCRHR